MYIFYDYIKVTYIMLHTTEGNIHSAVLMPI